MTIDEMDVQIMNLLKIDARIPEERPEDQRKFYDFVQKEDCILECSHITGPFSMLLKVVFTTTADLDTFIGQLQEFGKTETQVVFSTVLERH